MFSVINSSIMNNFTTVQELSRTLENTQGQSYKDTASFDSKFKESLAFNTLRAGLQYIRTSILA